MQEESLAHTKWECTYHIVFIPKYSRKVLYGEYRTEIRDIIKRLLEMYKLELVEGAVCADHIHISIRIPPKYVVSKVMGMLKGKSAMMLFDRHPEWKRKTGRDKTFWARGYYVSTVGINESVIRQYIKNQENADRIADGC